jgi:hypothetical protein
MADTWPGIDFVRTPGAFPPLDRGHLVTVEALLELIDGIPPDLLAAPPADQAQFLIAKTTIRSVVGSWVRGQTMFNIAPIPGLKTAIQSV